MASIQWSDKSNADGYRYGFNIVSWAGPNATSPDVWKEAIDKIYRSGMRSFTLVTHRFVDKKTGRIADNSQFGLTGSPTNGELVAAILEGKRLGMQVSINPFVEIDNPNGIGHEWRGSLDFSGPALRQFFKHYGGYLSEMASLASGTGTDRLYVGSELKALSSNPDARAHWSDLIGALRDIVGRKILLTYAANHDEYVQVPFWRELDEIGVDAYFSLASRTEAEGRGKPSVDLIKRAWFQHLRSLHAFSKEQERPILLSEWGIVPFDHATHEPWNGQPSDVMDSDEQISAYQATIEATLVQDQWLKGIQFWHWNLQSVSGSHFGIRDESRVFRLITEYLN